MYVFFENQLKYYHLVLVVQVVVAVAVEMLQMEPDVVAVVYNHKAPM
jgi:hypothetical protein